MFLIYISMVVVGAIGIALFRAFIWDKFVPKLIWKFGSPRQRIHLLLKIAEHKTHGKNLCTLSREECSIEYGT